MLLLIVSIAIQALLIIHCIKTGRNQIWVWVIALLPVAGPIAYLAAELLPELLRSRTTQRTVKGVARALDPERTLREAEALANASGNVAARQNYADELAKQGREADAIGVYREALTGLYEHDPKLLLGLAGAQFTSGDFSGTRATLDALIEHNPDFRSPDGHLLYARALESAGETPKALEEYQTLAGYYPGAEATVRYARLLRSNGQIDEADRLLQGLIEQARIAPAHYRRTQREWLDAAAAENQKIR